MRKIGVILAGLARFAWTGAWAADDRADAKGDAPKNEKADKAKAEKPAETHAAPQKFVSEHRLQSGATDITYTATAEDVQIHDNDGKATASFFTISYMKKGVARQEDRPVTFVFNGGPGSASVWLHFGLVGPKLIDIPSDASGPGAPPYKLKDNPWTILRATDVVFVDPVGTGFSHAMGEKKDKDFWGYDEDADSVAEFIRTFVTSHNRWNSPKYLLGESYGGVRSSMLVERLQQRLDIGLNGVMLISPALNLGTLPFVVAGNDLGYATHLPALAASALYHKKLPDAWPSQKALLDEVEAYAGGEYLQALWKGDQISKEEKDKVAERLHRYTGLSKEYILRSNLRIYAIRFIKELLCEEGKSVRPARRALHAGRARPRAEFPDGDPFNAKTSPIYIALFQSYLKNELKVDIESVTSDRTAKRMARGSGPPTAPAPSPATSTSLASSLRAPRTTRRCGFSSPRGYHDLTTSYFATEYMRAYSGSTQPG